MSAPVFSAAGPFRSDFFIAFIDHEYCLRLRKLGYKVIIANVPLMVHALGAPTTPSFDNRVGKFTLVLTNRYPLRRYYLNNAQISFDLRVETRIPTSSFFRSDVFSAV